SMPRASRSQQRLPVMNADHGQFASDRPAPKVEPPAADLYWSASERVRLARTRLNRNGIPVIAAPVAASTPQSCPGTRSAMRLFRPRTRARYSNEASRLGKHADARHELVAHTRLRLNDRCTLASHPNERRTAASGAPPAVSVRYARSISPELSDAESRVRVSERAHNKGLSAACLDFELIISTVAISDGPALRGKREVVAEQLEHTPISWRGGIKSALRAWFTCGEC